MNTQEEAILRTILYADIFNFPLTVEEIHHFLIDDAPVSCEQIHHRLTTSPALVGLLCYQNPYYMLADRPFLAKIRAEREEAAQTLWPLAVMYGMQLARIPFVRMVAITGSLAVRNPRDSNDDLDYMLVTESGRVWMARAFAILLVRSARTRGVEICPNYVLAEDALEQQHQNLYVAHDITQMIPIYGMDIYERFRQANPWASHHQPNAHKPFYHVAERNFETWNPVKRRVEAALRGQAGSAFENWEYRRKHQRFLTSQPSSPAAQIDANQVKGHFHDHGQATLRKYQERLQIYNLT